jgi:ATP-dependent DNA helicase RecQ
LGNYFQLPAGSGKDQDFDFDISEFARNFKLEPVTVYNSLKFLEREGYLVTTEALHEPSRLHITAGRETLYDFQLRNVALDSFIKVILRSYGGLFADFVAISEQDLAYRTGLTKEETIANIAHLQMSGLVSYIPQKDKPRIIFTEARLDQRHVIISDRHYKERKEQAIIRLDGVIGYATATSQCRSQSLLTYFGERQSAPCGKCDVCIERHKQKLNDADFEQLKSMIQTVLQKEPHTVHELVEAVHERNEDKVLGAVQWLLDHGTIVRDEKFRFKWNK